MLSFSYSIVTLSQSFVPMSLVSVLILGIYPQISSSSLPPRLFPGLPVNWLASVLWLEDAGGSWRAVEGRSRAFPAPQLFTLPWPMASAVIESHPEGPQCSSLYKGTLALGSSLYPSGQGWSCLPTELPPQLLWASLLLLSPMLLTKGQQSSTSRL